MPRHGNLRHAVQLGPGWGNIVPARCQAGGHLGPSSPLESSSGLVGRAARVGAAFLELLCLTAGGRGSSPAQLDPGAAAGCGREEEASGGVGSNLEPAQVHRPCEGPLEVFKTSPKGVFRPKNRYWDNIFTSIYISYWIQRGTRIIKLLHLKE